MKGFSQIFAENSETLDRYSALLSPANDVTFLVLKGHLVVEEILFSILGHHCHEHTQLEKARLTFAQTLCLVRAIQTIPVPDEMWAAIALLNQIRNGIAHRLVPEKTGEQIDRLYALCKTDIEFEGANRKPETPEGILRLCIYSLMSGLGLVKSLTESLRQNS